MHDRAYLTLTTRDRAVLAQHVVSDGPKDRLLEQRSGPSNRETIFDNNKRFRLSYISRHLSTVFDHRSDKCDFAASRSPDVRHDHFERNVGVNESGAQANKDLSIVSDVWPMFHHDKGHTGLSGFGTRSDRGNLRWKFPPDDEHESPGPIQPFSSPALSLDGTIYVGSSNGLSAIDRHGILKWRFQTKAQSDYLSPAIGRDGTIYFASIDRTLYAINSNGSLKWKFPTRAVPSSPTVGADGTIYLGSFDCNLYALNPNGTRKWVFKTTDKVPITPAISSDGTIYFSGGALNPNGTLKWRFQSSIASLPRFSPPAVASDGTIYFGGTDSHLHAVNPDGTVKWNFGTKRGYVFSTPAIGRDGTLYFGVNGGSYFYALNANGALKWKYETDGNVLSSAALGTDGTIYFGSEDGHFYALNPDGTQRWRFPHGALHENHPIKRHRARPYDNGKWHAAHNENSSETDRADAASAGSSPAIGSDGTIYFASTNGHLYAIH
jgi:outer membrane protein assembly factor BamB